MIIEGFNGIDHILYEFDIGLKDIENCKILAAGYYTPYHDGYAYILFEKEGKLYEVMADHCSCYGLQGQWEPEETFKEAILKRLESCPSEYDQGGLSTEDLIKLMESI